MQVFCINDTGWYREKKFLWIKYKKTVLGPKYGDIVTVCNSSWDEGCRYHHLLEWPSEDAGWEAECFVPLSDIDEIEMVRNYQPKKQTI